MLQEMLQNAKGPMRAAKANGEACEAGASYNSGAFKAIVATAPFFIGFLSVFFCLVVWHLEIL